MDQITNALSTTSTSLPDVNLAGSFALSSRISFLWTKLNPIRFSVFEKISVGQTFAFVGIAFASAVITYICMKRSYKGNAPIQNAEVQNQNSKIAEQEELIKKLQSEKDALGSQDGDASAQKIKDLEEQIQKLQSLNTKLDERIADLQAQLEKQKPNDELKTALALKEEKAQSALNEVEAEKKKASELEAKFQQLQSEKEDLNKQAVQSKADLESKKAEFSKEVAAKTALELQLMNKIAGLEKLSSENKQKYIASHAALQSTKNSLASLEEQIQTLESEKNSLNGKEEEYKKLQDNLESKKSEIASLKKYSDELEAKIQTLISEKENLKTQASESLTKLENITTEFAKKLAIYESDTNLLASKNDKLQESLKQKEEEFKQLEAAIVEKQKEIAAATQKSIALEEETQKFKIEAQSALNEVKTEKNKVSEQDTKLQQILAEKEDLNKQAEQLKVSLESITAAYEKEHSEKNILDKQIEDLQQQSLEKDQKFNASQAALQSTKNSLASLEEQISKLESKKTDLEKHISHLNDQLLDKDAKLNSSEMNDKLKVEIKELKQLIAQKEEEFKKLQGDLESKKSDIESLLKKSAELEELNKKLKSDKDILNTQLTKLQTELKSKEAEFSKKFAEKFETEKKLLDSKSTQLKESLRQKEDEIKKLRAEIAERQKIEVSTQKSPLEDSKAKPESKGLKEKRSMFEAKDKGVKTEMISSEAIDEEISQNKLVRANQELEELKKKNERSESQVKNLTETIAFLKTGAQNKQVQIDRLSLELSALKNKSADQEAADSKKSIADAKEKQQLESQNKDLREKATQLEQRLTKSVRVLLKEISRCEFNWSHLQDNTIYAALYKRMNFKELVKLSLEQQNALFFEAKQESSWWLVQSSALNDMLTYTNHELQIFIAHLPLLLFEEFINLSEDDRLFCDAIIEIIGEIENSQSFSKIIYVHEQLFSIENNFKIPNPLAIDFFKVHYKTLINALKSRIANNIIIDYKPQPFITNIDYKQKSFEVSIDNSDSEESDNELTTARTLPEEEDEIPEAPYCEIPEAPSDDFNPETIITAPPMVTVVEDKKTKASRSETKPSEKNNESLIITSALLQERITMLKNKKGQGIPKQSITKIDTMDPESLIAEAMTKRSAAIQGTVSKESKNESKEEASDNKWE